MSSPSDHSPSLSLEEIIQASPVPTFVLDADHRVIHWNHACEQVLGTPASELLGTHDQWKPFYPSRRPVMADLVISGEIDKLIGKYYGGKFHHSQVVKNSYEAEDYFPEIGNGTWLYFTASAIHDDQGQVIGAIETLQDITDRKRAELSEQQTRKQLQHSHDRLKTIIEHFPCGISVLDDSLTLVEHNQAFKRLMDIPDELLADGQLTLDELYQYNLDRNEYSQRDALSRASLLLEHTRSNQPFLIERKRPGGQVMEISGTPIPAGGYITSYTDITERKRIDKQLQQLLLEQQLIFQNAQVGIARLRDRNIINCNPKLAEMFGYDSATELIGQSTSVLYPSKTQWLRDGENLYQTLKQQGQITEEALQVCKNGDLLTVIRSGQLIDANDLDSIWIYVDISDRIQAEQALANKHQQLQAILDAAHEVSIIATDTQGQINLFNQGAEQMLGYRSEEMLGKTPLEFHLHEEVVEHQQRLQQHYDIELSLFETFVYSARHKGADTRDWTYIRKDGHQLQVSLVVTAVRDHNGDINGYLGIARDISEQRNAEQKLNRLNKELEQRVVDRTQDLQQALLTVEQTQKELARSDRMAALGSLVAGVSHELNTPIGNCVTVSSALLDNTEELQRSIQQGQIRRSSLDQYIESTLTACQLMLTGMQKAHKLVGEFKQIASDQTGEQRRLFRLLDIVSDLTALYQAEFRRQEIALTLDIAPELELDSYPGLLEQVINNLINNAILHGFNGQGGQINLAAEPGSDQTIRMIFSDNGSGIPAGLIEQVFDPFFTTKLGQGGSGLGLNIVYNIIHGALGGSLKLSSEPGAGTQVEICLPVVAPETVPSSSELMTKSNSIE